MFEKLTIDKRRATPLPQQIFDAMTEVLVSAFMPKGTLVPKPSFLARQLSVNEVDVLEAYQGLLDQGFIEQKNDQYLTLQRVVRLHHSSMATNIYQAVRAIGLNPTSKTQSIGPTQDLPIDLNRHKCYPNDAFYRMERLVYGDNLTLAFTRVHFSTHYFKGADKIQYDGRSFYEVLQEKMTFDVEMQRHVSAVPLPESLAKTMNLPKGTPMLYMESFGHNPDGYLVDYSQAWLVASYFSFEFQQKLT